MDKIAPEERERMARAYFRDGYNCCQSVLLAFKDLIDLPEDRIAGLGSGFGGGMGRMREVCGAVSGMTFLAGVISPSAHPERTGERTANYSLVQQFASSFREENGSIICRELLNLRAEHRDSPQPSARTKEYYTNRPCERMVGSAARIVAGYLNK